MLTYLKEPVRVKKVVLFMKNLLCNLENQDPKHLYKKLMLWYLPFATELKCYRQEDPEGLSGSQSN